MLGGYVRKRWMIAKSALCAWAVGGGDDPATAGVGQQRRLVEQKVVLDLVAGDIVADRLVQQCRGEVGHADVAARPSDLISIAAGRSMSGDGQWMRNRSTWSDSACRGSSGSTERWRPG